MSKITIDTIIEFIDNFKYPETELEDVKIKLKVAEMLLEITALMGLWVHKNPDKIKISIQGAMDEATKMFTIYKTSVIMNRRFLPLSEGESLVEYAKETYNREYVLAMAYTMLKNIASSLIIKKWENENLPKLRKRFISRHGHAPIITWSR